MHNNGILLATDKSTHFANGAHTHAYGASVCRHCFFFSLFFSSLSSHRFAAGLDAILERSDRTGSKPPDASRAHIVKCRQDGHPIVWSGQQQPQFGCPDPGVDD